MVLWARLEFLACRGACSVIRKSLQYEKNYPIECLHPAILLSFLFPSHEKAPWLTPICSPQRRLPLPLHEMLCPPERRASWAHGVKGLTLLIFSVAFDTLTNFLVLGIPFLETLATSWDRPFSILLSLLRCSSSLPWNLDVLCASLTHDSIDALNRPHLGGWEYWEKKAHGQALGLLSDSVRSRVPRVPRSSTAWAWLCLFPGFIINLQSRSSSLYALNNI